MNEYFSWYPGHIAKAENLLKTHWLSLTDLVIELIDSRVYKSSEYQDRNLFKNKIIIKVYTKGDLCNLSQLEPDFIVIDSRDPERWKRKLNSRIKQESQVISEKLKEKGRNRKLRLGVMGMPNVGKSTFLNSFFGKAGKKAKTGNLPGVTRQVQFVEGKDFDFLDTPGICPVKILRQDAVKLALCNLIPEKLFAQEELSESLYKILESRIPEFKNNLKNNNYNFKLILEKFRNGAYNLCLD